MPKGKNNKGKGKGRKKKQQSVYEYIDETNNNILIAHVDGRPGGRHIDVTCSDTIERKMFIRNAIRTRLWLNPGDIIIVSLNTYM